MADKPVDRELVKRDGVSGVAAQALGRIITAKTQAGPIRYKNKSGGEYCTVDYLAVGVTSPTTVHDIVAPLLGAGKVTHGGTKDNLNGWNVVVDIAENRAQTMSLPQRMDQVANCLRQERIQLNKTVYLSIYTGVSYEMNIVGIMKQVTHTLDRFHPVLICLKDLSALSTWVQGFNIAQQQKAQAKVSNKIAGRGKGAKGGGRGAGTKANNKIVTKTAVTPRGRGRGKGAAAAETGRIAGAGKGGKKGKGKGGKKTVAEGLTMKVNRSGIVQFNKMSPY
eukprot:TRINITY_DN4605_c0_g5_i1.p1 TRINITY_DN4605_c0_g5~~TRINITY_DN4605_c0_g5_i1.p1  ORF type:complete len:279 (+),score=29.08 TRINITY_DN4605_c0_g5_i1:49-885(+)